MPFIGIYVASIVLIGWFMRWLGNYSWLTVIAVALGMPIVTYFMFREAGSWSRCRRGRSRNWLGL